MDTAWAGEVPEVGATATRSRTVSSEDITRFTETSGDRNPLHYNEDLAGGSVFGGIIVQGGVKSAILNAVVAEDLPGPGTVFLHVDWNFRTAVRPGDVITGHVEVLEVRTDKPMTRLATTVSNQQGTVVLDGEALSTAKPSATPHRFDPVASRSVACRRLEFGRRLCLLSLI